MQHKFLTLYEECNTWQRWFLLLSGWQFSQSKRNQANLQLCCIYTISVHSNIIAWVPDTISHENGGQSFMVTLTLYRKVTQKLGGMGAIFCMWALFWEMAREIWIFTNFFRWQEGQYSVIAHTRIFLHGGRLQINWRTWSLMWAWCDPNSYISAWSCSLVGVLSTWGWPSRPGAPVYNTATGSPRGGHSHMYHINSWDQVKKFWRSLLLFDHLTALHNGSWLFDRTGNQPMTVDYMHILSFVPILTAETSHLDLVY